MAKQYWGIDRGDTQQSGDVTTGTSVLSKGVEIVVDLAQSQSKNDVLNNIEEIKKEILKSNWPPA